MSRDDELYTHNTKNFRMQGGDISVFEGVTYFHNGAIVIEDCDVEGFPKAEHQAASSATDVADLRADFNSLLSKLVSAGLMEESK